MNKDGKFEIRNTKSEWREAALTFRISSFEFNLFDYSSNRPSFRMNRVQEVLRHVLEGADLFHTEEWQDRIPWRAFEPGVEIHRIYGDGVTGPTAALLRFKPGGRIPRHEHAGYEHILVLAGSQVDDFGKVPKGGLRIHSPGSAHSVVSEEGCIVLAIYEKPVLFGSAGE